MSPPAQRIAWAVATLAPTPGEPVLEIGPGHGAALDLVCEAGAVPDVLAAHCFTLTADLARTSVCGVEARI